MLGATFLKIDVDLAEPMHEEDEVGAECAIDQKFAAPMTVFVLLAQKVLLRARNRFRNFCVSGNKRLRLFRAS